MIAEKWGISREDMEEFALDSHPGRCGPSTRAASTAEIVPWRRP
jgi:acetyl-CoA acetyltransferase